MPPDKIYYREHELAMTFDGEGKHLAHRLGFLVPQRFPRCFHQAKVVLPKNVASKASPRIEQSLLAGVAGGNSALRPLLWKEVGHRCVQSLGDFLQPVEIIGHSIVL